MGRLECFCTGHVSYFNVGNLPTLCWFVECFYPMGLENHQSQVILCLPHLELIHYNVIHCDVTGSLVYFREIIPFHGHKIQVSELL